MRDLSSLTEKEFIRKGERENYQFEDLQYTLSLCSRCDLTTTTTTETIEIIYSEYLQAEFSSF